METWREACDLVDEYDWLFHVHPTDLFLHKDLLARLEHEFECDDFDDMKDLVHLITKPTDSKLTKLAHFISKCHEYTLLHEQSNDETNFKYKRHGISEKKAYEVHKMVPLILKTAKNLHISHFVDIGAGQGYLDFEVLDHDERYSLTAVERAQDQLSGLARRRGCVDRIKIVEMNVDFNTNVGSFQKSINAHSDYLMFSLHSCGSLSDHMCRLFVEDDRAKALICVGCCYNLITVPSFPQSTMMRLHARPSRLSSQQLMAACQVPMRWSFDGKAVMLTELKNYYRALLEVLARSQNLEFGSVGKLKVVVGETKFADYVKMALPNQHIENSDSVIEEYSSFRKHLQVYWTLRSCMGQVIESLIQMDRLFKLQECVPNSKLVSIFSLRHSPRRFAIVAVKDQSNNID